jgi:hypothetical protein
MVRRLVVLGFGDSGSGRYVFGHKDNHAEIIAHTRPRNETECRSYAESGIA